MKTAVAIATALMLTLTAVSIQAQTQRPSSPTWIATGTVTEVTGATAHVLMKDRQTYAVNMSNAQVVVRGRISNYLALRTGDVVKVTGELIGPTAVRADRALVDPPGGLPTLPGPPIADETDVRRHDGDSQRVIVIYGEEQPGAGPAPSLAPAVPVRVRPPAPPVDTVRRGFIADLRYGDETMTLQTSDGLFSVNLAPATIVRSGRTVGIGTLSPGDAVQVSGQAGDLRTMTAARLDVLTRNTGVQRGGDIQRRVVTGSIYWIDYPSFTFRMRGAPQEVQVLVDEGTIIRDENREYPFTALGPGIRVKITGYGSPMNGYVANEVFVTSALPAQE